MAAPFKKKRKHYQKFTQQILNFVETVEHRQRARTIRNGFFRIKMVSECDKMINIFSSLNNLGSQINSNTQNNVKQIQGDVNVLQQGEIFKKIVKNCLGKYIKCQTKLRGHRLQCMMEEKLDKATLSKLMERLCSVAEGTVKGWRSNAYGKLKRNSLLVEKKRKTLNLKKLLK